LQSLVGGLYAGATIEEIDMAEFQHAINAVTLLDVVNAYQNRWSARKTTCGPMSRPRLHKGSVLHPCSSTWNSSTPLSASDFQRQHHPKWALTTCRRPFCFGWYSTGNREYTTLDLTNRNSAQ
jgi:hypothetical protein